MTQFKDKAQKVNSSTTDNNMEEQELGSTNDNNANEELLRGVGSGLLMYPVLMAADIMLYNATHVPVGDDQTQHLEMTREIVRIMNHNYSKKSPIFVEPECVYNTEASRVMSLKNATSKMSKSDVIESSRITLVDSNKDIKSKIKGAQTDSLGGVSYNIKERPGVSNLVDIALAVENAQRRRQFLQTLEQKLQSTQLYQQGYCTDAAKLHTLAFTPEYSELFEGMCAEYMSIADTFEAGVDRASHEDIVNQFANSKLSAFKEYIGDQLVQEIEPIREKTKSYLTREDELHDILKDGADYANKKAEHTMSKIHKAMGYVAPK